ncbi:MAG: hypothetical protein ACTSRG_22160 [Candidatus Helarchaeota archaeon]
MKTDWKSMGALFPALIAGKVLRTSIECVDCPPNKDFPSLFLAPLIIKGIMNLKMSILRGIHFFSAQKKVC